MRRVCSGSPRSVWRTSHAWSQCPTSSPSRRSAGTSSASSASAPALFFLYRHFLPDVALQWLAVTDSGPLLSCCGATLHYVAMLWLCSFLHDLFTRASLLAGRHPGVILSWLCLSHRCTLSIFLNVHRQRVGAKIQCTSCYTAYHPLCARIAGLHMEILDGEGGPDAPVSALLCTCS